MRLNKYIPEGHYYQNLADARQTGLVRVMFGGIEAKRDEIRGQNENKPMLCDEDFTKDVRFKLGAVWAFNWVLSLPDEARKIIEKLPGI